ncbi:MAG: precorrin-8X methylmutase [Pseudomonadota bacterium]
MTYTYLKNPEEIYQKSFAIVKEKADISALPPELHPIAIRLVHACGMTDIVNDLEFSPNVVEAATNVLQKGHPILCDCEMVRVGIITRQLNNNKIITTLNDQSVTNLAQNMQTTRSAAAIELWQNHIENAVVVIGNAPTALFHLLERLQQGWPKPAAILGFPVGFVGAAESKTALAEFQENIPFLTLHGNRGGSAMASAALNAIASISNQKVSA